MKNIQAQPSHKNWKPNLFVGVPSLPADGSNIAYNSFEASCLRQSEPGALTIQKDEIPVSPTAYSRESSQNPSRVGCHASRNARQEKQKIESNPHVNLQEQ